MSATAPPRDHRAWSSRPGPAPPEELSVLATEAVAIAAAAIGPISRSNALPHSRGLLIFAVIGLTSIAVGTRPERPWITRLALPAIAAGALYPLEGVGIAAWVFGSLVLADWAIRCRPPLPGLPRPTIGAWVPTLVISLIAGRVAQPTAATYQPLVVQAAVLIPILATSRPSRLRTWLDGLAHWITGPLTHAVRRGVGFALSTITFGLLGIFLVVVPWIVQRIRGVDPLVLPQRTRGWMVRTVQDTRPSRSWAPAGMRPQFNGWYRVRQFWPVVVAGLVVTVLVLKPSDDGTPPPEVRFVGQSRAFEGEPWYPEYLRDVGWVTQGAVAWRPLRRTRMEDVSTRYVNVIDGHRKTWAPPRCKERSCPELTVWLYGGSTTWGVGQRDDHTIPSELARVAYRRGIRLRVVNKGELGEAHWMEADRLNWDLSRHTPPDLVLFYDGVNEAPVARGLLAEGLGDAEREFDPTIDAIETKLANDPAYNPPAPPTPPGAKFEIPAGQRSTDPTQIGKLALARYARARKMSEAILRAYRLPAVFLWQPSKFSRPPVEGEPVLDDASLERMDRRIAVYIQRHPTAGTVDLTHVFDDVKGPLFSDEVHHNERGARIVAEAIFEAIRPRLEQLR